MEYNITLKFPAIFSLSRLLKKAGLTREVLALFDEGKKEKDDSKEKANEFGMKLFAILIDGMGNAEQETYKFIESITDMDYKAVKDMDFVQVKDFFMQLFKTAGIADFFTQASNSKG